MLLITALGRKEGVSLLGCGLPGLYSETFQDPQNVEDTQNIHYNFFFLSIIISDACMSMNSVS